MNENEVIKKIIKIIEENPIKTITTFIISMGLIYLGIYYFNNEFLPRLSTEEFIQLSFIFFAISFLVSITLTIVMFMPAEHLYTILSNDFDIGEKIFSGLILFIVIIMFIIYILWIIKLIEYKQDFSVFFYLVIFIIIILFNLAYFKSKKENNLKKLSILMLIIFISLNILLSPILAINISKIFHLGNYTANLNINNETICKTIFHKKNKVCSVKGKIIWNIGNNYILEINNTKYKIPSKYILMEYFPDIKNNKQNKKDTNNTKDNKKKNNNQKRK